MDRSTSGKTHFVEPKDVALPHRSREAHKGDFGRVCILAGCVGYTGAPVLCAKAAVRSGAGLVTLLVPASIWQVAAQKLDCAMPWPLPAGETGALSPDAYEEALVRLNAADTALIGPGLSREGACAETVRRLIAHTTAPLVLDADGINALEGHIHVLDDRRGKTTVLTPHDGEFARLGGDLSAGDRVEVARQFAGDHGCVLVLKGHRTVTTFPDGEVYVNTTGNPGMAKGGSGDVLGGVMASLMAQGIPLKQAAPWAVCLHGQAGDMAAEELGEYGMTPVDLLEKLPLTMKKF
jgi:NAD(P)H-hydrate epimerase